MGEAPQITTVTERQTLLSSLPDRERRNPLFRWLMHLGLPAGVSLLIHLAVLAGAGLYTFSVVAFNPVEVGQYEAGLMQRADERIQDAFQWGQEIRLATPEIEPLQELTFDDFSRVSTVTERDVMGEVGSGLGDGDGDPGLGIGEGRFSLLGTGGGAGETGSGGFGEGMGGRGGLGRAGMWDLSIAANTIVYVVDFSGSIIVAVDDLKRELKRSVGRLRPSQAFNVIIFYSEGTGRGSRFRSESFAPNLQSATQEVREQFFTWLDAKSPRGETEPLPSVRRALSMRPEAIFFFSDGLFDDSVVGEIEQANRGRDTRVICFVFDEILLEDTSGLPNETQGAARLRRIAEQNRGQVKIVTGRDLGRR